MIAQYAMFAAAASYTVASVAYLIEGKPWTGATVLLYAIGAITVYLGGKG